MDTHTWQAFAEELIKVATNNEDDVAADAVRQRKRALVGGIVAVGGGAAGGGLASHLAATTPESSSHLLEKLRSGTKTPIVHTDIVNGRDFSNGALYDFDGKRVVIGKNMAKSPAALAHELGHAEIAKSRLGRLVQNKATNAVGTLSPYIGVGTGALTGYSDNKNVQRAGVLAPLLAAAPQLAYEGGASLHALRSLRRAGASRKEMLRAAGTLAPAFGTYAANAGLGVAGAAYSQAVVRGARRELARQNAQE